MSSVQTPARSRREPRPHGPRRLGDLTVLLLGPAALGCGLWLLTHPGAGAPGPRDWTDLMTLAATLGLVAWGAWWSAVCSLAMIAGLRRARTGTAPRWAQRLPRRCLLATGLATTVALSAVMPAQASQHPTTVATAMDTSPSQDGAADPAWPLADQPSPTPDDTPSPETTPTPDGTPAPETTTPTGTPLPEPVTPDYPVAPTSPASTPEPTSEAKSPEAPPSGAQSSEPSTTPATQGTARSTPSPTPSLPVAEAVASLREAAESAHHAVRAAGAGWEAPRPARDLPPTLGGTRRHEVIVAEGDSLWSVAAQHLGAGATDHDVAQEWPRWYRANRDVIGDDPGLLHPGTRLLPPAA
jgi:hypothetical protein